MHKRTAPIKCIVFACVYLLILPVTIAESAQQGGGENASNPLAKVKNTDLRWQYLDAKVMQL